MPGTHRTDWTALTAKAPIHMALREMTFDGQLMICSSPNTLKSCVSKSAWPLHPASQIQLPLTQ
eukprot:5276482-Pleurochrysis_carterae.AAC.1